MGKPISFGGAVGSAKGDDPHFGIAGCWKDFVYNVWTETRFLRWERPNLLGTPTKKPGFSQP